MKQRWRFGRGETAGRGATIVAVSAKMPTLRSARQGAFVVARRFDLAPMAIPSNERKSAASARIDAMPMIAGS